MLQEKKTTLTKAKDLNVNRHILPKLILISLKQEKVIDFKKTLKYFLSPITLNLCKTDGVINKQKQTP